MGICIIKCIIIELDNDGFVEEWDLCLDDCPHETPKIVCQEDPKFPKLIITDGRTTPIEVNFTTTYTPGVGLITDELDYVVFDCPEGYTFKNMTTNNVFAICYNWSWALQYDPETHCYREEENLTNTILFY